MDPFYQPPVAQKPPLISQRLGLIIGLLVSVVVVGILLMMFSGGNKDADGYARAVARQEALVNLLNEGENDISSAELSKINIDAKLFATSSLVGLQAELGQFGLGGVPNEITAAETDTTIKDALEQAVLQNRFDQTYTEMLLEKIDAQQALLQDLYNKLPPSRPKDQVKATLDSLQTVQNNLKTLKF